MLSSKRCAQEEFIGSGSGSALAALGVALALAVMLALSAATAFGQSQPNQAVNNQDERVNIPAPNPNGDGLLTIFRSGDKQQVSRYITQMVELKNALAMEVLPHVEKAVKLEGGVARALKYTDPKTSQTRSFIQIVTTERQMPSVVAAAQAMDLPGVTSSEGELQTALRMKYRRASEVSNLLAFTSLSSDGKVFPDDASNTLWVFDSQSDGKRDLAFVDYFDVPPPQVEFEVQVIEISENDTTKAGLDWDAWKRSLGGQIDFTGNAYKGGSSFSRLDSLLTLDARVLAEFLNYTVQSGTAKAVQCSRVTASNETPAVVSSAKRVSYVDYSRTEDSSKVVTEDTPGYNATGEIKNDSADTKNGKGQRTVMITPQATFTKKDDSKDQEGIVITIQPTIGTEMVTARIRVEDSTVESFTELDKPLLASRVIDTMATLKNKEPFLVGSLRRETATKYRRGIPGLKDIWGVKYAFSIEAQRSEKSRIFVIATPTFRNQLEYTAKSLLWSSSKPMEPTGKPLSQPLPADAAEAVSAQQSK